MHVPQLVSLCFLNTIHDTETAVTFILHNLLGRLYIQETSKEESKVKLIEYLLSN